MSNNARPKIPYHTLELIVRKLAEDRFQKIEEIGSLRKQNDELHTLLRSALWELAGAQGSNNRRRFSDDWINDRIKREL